MDWIEEMKQNAEREQMERDAKNRLENRREVIEMREQKAMLDGILDRYAKNVEAIQKNQYAEGEAEAVRRAKEEYRQADILKNGHNSINSFGGEM